MTSGASSSPVSFVSAKVMFRVFRCEFICSTGRMKRRLFTQSLGAGAFGIATRAAAQQVVPVVGVLVSGSPESFQPLFVEAMRRLGYEPGKNINYNVQSGQGDASQLSALASVLIRANVQVLVARLTPAVMAASRATQRVPIIMAGAGDPVGNGLVESLARPGRNITGVAGVAGLLSGKLVELVREVIPGARDIAVLANPTDPFTATYTSEIERAGREQNIQTRVIMIADATDLEKAFEHFKNSSSPPQAVIVQPSLPRAAAATLALLHRLPSFSPISSFAKEGGFMGYSSDEVELFEQTAEYVDRILKGAVPALLPVSQPTKFDLVINTRTARLIGLPVPVAVQMRASDFVE